MFLNNNAGPVAELIAAVTGWDMDWAEALKAGRRILTMRQAFNAREGRLPDEFKLPERLSVPHSVEEAAGQNIDFDTLRKAYFTEMGWDIVTGKPNRATLIELGLDELAKDLYQ